MNSEVNVLDKIMRYEMGEMTGEETIEFFQMLASTKILYRLQGHYHRVAVALARAELINIPS